jgi:hypothetical protein
MFTFCSRTFDEKQVGSDRALLVIWNVSSSSQHGDSDSGSQHGDSDSMQSWILGNVDRILPFLTKRSDSTPISKAHYPSFQCVNTLALRLIKKC